MRQLLVLLSVLALFPACSEVGGNGPLLGSATVTVEVDAESATLAPTFGLTNAQASSLALKLRRAEETHDTTVVPQARPGYRGFWVQSAGDSTSVPVSMWIGQGIVIDITPEGIRRTYLDTAGVEEELLNIAKDRGYGDFFNNDAAGVKQILPQRSPSPDPRVS